MGRLRAIAKRLLMPGVDPCLRERYRLLRRYLITGPATTLDVGSGNGAFSLYAQRLGNHVTAISVDPRDVATLQRDQALVRGTGSCTPLLLNAYDVGTLSSTFDQILCFEVLEHLQHDVRAVASLAGKLNPGGILHVSAPNEACPLLYGDLFSTHEDGGHVRRGYSFASLEALLIGAGLQVVRRVEIGGWYTVLVSSAQRRVLEWLKLSGAGGVGTLVAMVVWVFLRPLALVRRPEHPSQSLYVAASKPPV